jgi:hypothetical protein
MMVVRVVARHVALQPLPQGPRHTDQQRWHSCRRVPSASLFSPAQLVSVLGAVSLNIPTCPANCYTNIVTVNSAGAILLFLRANTPALVTWPFVLRLTAWEMARLEY